MDWLAPLRQALDEAPAAVPVFFRDDDAGWDDGRLFALLDLFAHHRVPIDLAVIPAALTPPLARELAARADLAPGRLGLHQHGYCHANHEATGRKCEFGASRRLPEQWRDLEQGARLLREALGPRLDPIFTPPWNRCTPLTARCLAELGFAALSRDAGAEPLHRDGLAEIGVHIDWCKRRDGRRRPPEELAVDMAARARAGRSLGIMLHHAVMDDEDLDLLGPLLRLVAQHVNCRSRLMRQVVGR